MTVDGHNTGTFWKTAFLTAPLLFVVSMNVNLRGPYDLVTTSSAKPYQKQYTPSQVFIWNYLWWTVWYFIGMQFTHLDHGILQRFVLKWSIMRTWPPVLWVVFVAFLAIVGFVATSVIEAYIEAGVLK